MTIQQPPDTETLRIELQEAIITFRAQITLLVQIAGVLATADALLLGYGFAQRQSAIFLVAGLLPVVLLVVGLEFARYVAPIIYVAMRIEQELGLRATSLVSLFAMRAFRRVLPTGDGLTDVGAAEIAQLILEMSPAVILRSRAAYVAYGVIIVQFGLFMLATFSAGYHFM